MHLNRTQTLCDIEQNNVHFRKLFKSEASLYMCYFGLKLNNVAFISKKSYHIILSFWHNKNYCRFMFCDNFLVPLFNPKLYSLKVFGGVGIGQVSVLTSLLVNMDICFIKAVLFTCDQGHFSSNFAAHGLFCPPPILLGLRYKCV